MAYSEQQKTGVDPHFSELEGGRGGGLARDMGGGGEGCWSVGSFT